jgi:hypothetical protein
MGKVYLTHCIVKKNGRSWKKGSVIKDLIDEEIKQGLAEHWLEAVGSDEEPKENKPNGPPKTEKSGKPGKGKTGKPGPADPLEKMTAGELLAEAVKLGLQADNSMPAETILKMIREAQK